MVCVSGASFYFICAFDWITIPFFSINQPLPLQITPLSFCFSSPSCNCSWLKAVESMQRGRGINEFQRAAKWGLIKVLPPRSLTFQCFWWSFKSLPLQMSLIDSLQWLTIWIDAIVGVSYRLGEGEFLWQMGFRCVCVCVCIYTTLLHG